MIRFLQRTDVVQATDVGTSNTSYLVKLIEGDSAPDLQTKTNAFLTLMRRAPSFKATGVHLVSTELEITPLSGNNYRYTNQLTFAFIGSRFIDTFPS